MARPKAKQKGPGSGRPGVPRKYAKDKKRDPGPKPLAASTRTTPTTEPDIDFSAPLRALDNPTHPETPISPLIDNNIYINNNDDISHEVVIDRDKKTKVNFNNPPRKQQTIKDDKVLIPEIIDDSEKDQTFDLKSQLTAKELNFIELYLTGDHTQIEAMKLVGYSGYNEKYLYRLSRKIMEKYELQAGDDRKLLQDLGYNKIMILKLLIDSATKARSETVKLNARIALARCAGIRMAEVIEAAEGVQIIIKTTAKQGQQPPQQGQAGALPEQQEPTIKVRMIK